MLLARRYFQETQTAQYNDKRAENLVQGIAGDRWLKQKACQAPGRYGCAPFAFAYMLCGCLLLHSQPAGGQSGTAAGSISGVVRDSIYGAPVPSVNVSAAGASSTTDAQGRYSLRGIKPGRVQISAELPGALGPTGKVVGLAGGQDLTGIDIRVPNMASISGKITGEDEKPLAGINVYLVGREYAFGALRYPYSGSATTDEGGRYTLQRVPPGRGFLILARKEAGTLKPVSEAPAEPGLRAPVPAPTYYPGANAIETAVPLVLGPGEKREFVNMTMRLQRVYCIEGTVRPATGSLPVEFGISAAQPVSLFGLSILDAMSHRGSAENVNRSGFISRGRTGPDGKIRICDLHPGSYEISAGSGDRFGAQTVTIADRDVSDVLVTAEPAVPVSGEIVLDGVAPETPVKGQVGVLYGRARSGTPPDSVSVSIPGAFPFRAPILKDDYILAVYNLPGGVYLKDVSYGGRSISNTLFHPWTTAEPSSIRFVLAQNGGRVVVNAADEEGKPVSDADVVVMPANADSEAGLASGLAWGQTDSYGAWTSESIPPGKYYVIAGFFPVNRSPDSIGKLWSARTKAGAQEIDVGPGAAVSVRLSPTGID